MSYRLDKPYTDKQKMNFIVKYNHQMGLRIEKTEQSLFALEEWEDIEDGEVVDHREEWEEEQAQKERERLDNLNVTRGDMFEALILARQITKPQIRAMIEQYVTEPVQQALFLNRFDEALDFYRGYPVFDLLGAMLNPVITPEQWDNYFLKATNEDTKAEAYKELLPVEATEENSDSDHSDQSGDMVDEDVIA